jgi:hypothetical protein
MASSATPANSKAAHPVGSGGVTEAVEKVRALQMLAEQRKVGSSRTARALAPCKRSLRASRDRFLLHKPT